MKTMRQCCGYECNNNVYCEEDAWRRYQKQRMEVYKKIFSSPLFLYSIPFVIGFILGRLL